MAGEFCEEGCEIFTGELPFEGPGNLFEVDFKLAEPIGDRSKGRKVVWRERFSLDDGKIDFDLVQQLA